MKVLQKLMLSCLVGLLVISQGLSVSATGSADQASKLDIQMDDSSTDGKTTIHIKTRDTIERMDIDLPEGVAFNLESNKQANPALSVEYNPDSRRVSVKSKNDVEKVSLVLTDIKNERNTLTLHSWSAGVKVEQIAYSFTVAVQAPADEIVADQETATEESGQQEEAVEQANDLQTQSKESDASDAPEKLEPENNQVTQQKNSAAEPTVEEEMTAEKDAGNVSPFSYSETNLELYLSPSQKEVLSGKTANYELDIKVTGSQTTYTNVKFVVNLPKNPDVPVAYPQIVGGVVDESLMIAGVTPVYNEAEQTLTYQFDQLMSGQVYKAIIKATPLLGLTPVSDLNQNQRQLAASATIQATELTAPLSTGDQTTNILSNGAVAVTKAYSGSERLFNGSYEVVDGAPVWGDLSVWTIKTNIPKKNAGLSYIREGSKITIKDYIPEGLLFDASYQKPGFTGVYDAATRTVTWEFDAPDFNEQEQSTDFLFEQEVQIVLEIEEGVPEYSRLENKAEINYDLHGSSEQSSSSLSKQATASMQIGGGGVVVPPIGGSYYYGFHGGAVNGIGEWETAWDQNLGTSVPTVTDDASLTFMNSIYIAPYGLNVKINNGAWSDKYTSAFYQQILNSGYKRYTMEYSIDNRLDLTHLNIKKPTSNYINTQPARPLEELPDVFIQLKINGLWQGEHPVTFSPSAASTGSVSVTQYGKAEGEHVEAYRVIYRNASGEMQSSIWSEYDVHDGMTGYAANSVKYNYELNDGTKVQLVPTGDTSVHGNRYVNIVDQTETSPIVETSIQFVDGAGSEIESNIQRGNNRIKVELLNTSASTDNVTGPIELVALLPKGVNILDQPNLTFSDNSINPTYEVLGEVNGQQQVKFIFENNRLLPAGKLSASFDVDVTGKALSELNMQVYGYSSNSHLQVPAYEGEVLTQSVLETDSDDLNQNNNTEDFRVKSANRYTITKNDNLQITKEVKGGLDDQFSLFGHTTPDGDVTYRFNLTNTTGEIIEQFSFLDVLPSVGDLGITDNEPRDSRFEVALTGPISFVGTKWEDQVTVYYSTSKNPKRDDLYANVDHPGGSTPAPNPEGAEEPNWKTASEITDWNSIHSFMIVMKEGVEWLEGQDVSFEISAKAPSLPVDRELLDPSIAEQERAAWNSFAVTTNGLLAVEPLRVGVVMEYEIKDPVVEKTVNGQTDTLNLANRDEVFTWEVDYQFGNYTMDWTSAEMSDQIHELLEIQEVRVIDQNGNDVTANGTLSIVDNLVKFTLNKKDGNFGYLADQTYTLEIDSKIKASVTNEELLPFIQGTGIPNEAVLVVDDDPTHSNEVNVKPPGYGSLQVIKVDKDSKDESTGDYAKHLSGAEFELQRCETNEAGQVECVVIAEGITDVDGLLMFEDLPFGDYRLVETKAPEGYTLLTAPLEVTITEAGQIVELEVENTKTGWELPETGGIGTVLFYGGGALLMAAAGIALVRRREEDQ